MELVKIIEKHDLKYFLVCGSMLGAKRHNGFIPRNDDLDVGMLREDYEKLLTVLPKELPEGIKLQTPNNDKYSPVLFAKPEIHLAAFYGDWKKLPPEDQRGNHQNIFDLDFGSYESKELN